MTLPKGFKIRGDSTLVAPWWQTGYFLFDGDGDPVNESFYFRRKQRSAFAYKNDHNQLFYNNQPWPVYVDEIRFMVNKPSLPNINDILGCFSFRVQSSKYGSMWDEWALATALCNAPPERFNTGLFRPNGRFILPQPYYLSVEDNFYIRAYAAYNQAADYGGFQFGLLGFDPVNESPVVRVSDPVTIAAGSQNDFALTNDRDKASRAMFVESVTFSAYPDTSIAFVEVEINPPTGPRWTDDVTTPLGVLYDQPRLSGLVTSDCGGIHIPGSPYVIEPGGNFYVEGQLLVDPASTTANSMLVCCLYGHQEVPIDYYR